MPEFVSTRSLSINCVSAYMPCLVGRWYFFGAIEGAILSELYCCRCIITGLCWRVYFVSGYFEGSLL